MPQRQKPGAGGSQPFHVDAQAFPGKMREDRLEKISRHEPRLFPSSSVSLLVWTPPLLEGTSQRSDVIVVSCSAPVSLVRAHLIVASQEQTPPRRAPVRFR